MLYLIGLGLNEKGISLEGIEAIKKCDRVYLENYTVDFPYDVKKLGKIIKKEIIPADRNLVERDTLVKEAKKQDVTLLVYGSPLTATTHISLIEEAKKEKIKCEVIYAASIFDAVAETGLQIYKFGKIASMPAWKKNFEPTSFMEVIRDNQKINAHSLLLIDINLNLENAIEELEISAKKEKIKLGKIIVCSKMGTSDRKIIYDEIKNLKNKKIAKPYCIIIPSKLHFIEEEVLDRFE